MRLFIAEKPSLGKAIAAQLPGQKKPTRTHIQCGSDVVTWAFGHLYELAEPDAYLPDSVPVNGSGKKRWRLEDLPIIPQAWQKVAKASAKDQLAAIKALLKDVSEVVNAGDPDREGQLLVDVKWSLRSGPHRRVLIWVLHSARILVGRQVSE